MQQARSDPFAGRLLKGVEMTDLRWPGQEGWRKFSQNINGVEIHYVLNEITGQVDDFKFK
jgi:filamentous hemagglutinin